MSRRRKRTLFVIGTGMFGLTVADLMARQWNVNVQMIERRDHLGGNAYSTFDAETGIEVHQYGAHIFHTSNERVWNYVNRFTRFTDYVHRVKTVHHDRVYSMPINLGTMCEIAGMRMSPTEARAWVRHHAAEVVGRPRNLEEKAISLVGRPLYEALIKGYTVKQWQTDPVDLPPEIITRLPVRYTFDDRYFSDRWQGIPDVGYADWIFRMADHENIKVTLDTEWNDVKYEILSKYPVVYTGPLDAYFNYSAGRLGWRTLDLDVKTLPVSDYQGCSVLNEADEYVPHTRTIEFHHFNPERARRYPADKTIICRETSRTAEVGDEPYYPINTADDHAKLTRYRELVDRERDQLSVLFGGRLGTYRYLDMHMAIASALNMVRNRLPDVI